MRALRLGYWLPLLVSLSASASRPMPTYPCDDATLKLAAAADAEASKSFKTRLTGTCTCGSAKCDGAKVTYILPFDSPTNLAVTVRYERRLGPWTGSLSEYASPAALKAFAARITAQSLVRALIKEGGAECVLLPSWKMSNARCTAGPWLAMFFEDDRGKDGPILHRTYWRMPLSALEGDPDFELAKEGKGVAQFLALPGDVGVSFSDGSGARMAFKRGLQVGANGRDTFSSAFTVLFKLGPDVSDRPTRIGVKETCAGDQYYVCDSAPPRSADGG